jgi:type I restriction enzyme, S subunit
MKDWKIVKLGEVLERADRFEKRDSLKKYSFSGTYSYARGIFKSYDKNGSEFNLEKIQTIKTNDFIYCKIMAWEGAFGLVPPLCNNTVMSGAFAAYIIDETKLNTKFLEFFFKMEKVWKEIGSDSKGTNIRRKTLYTSDFEKFQIPLPLLAEQQRIANYLDNLKSKIDEVKRLREEQDKLRQYIRYSFMVDCEKKYQTKTIGELCRIKKGSFSIMKTEMGKFPLVVTGEKRKSASDYDFDCEAVCIPLVSSTGHGNAALNRVHYEKGQFALANIICALIVKEPEHTSTKYLYELFMAMKDLYLVPLMQGSANVTLSMDKIASVKVPIPPIAEQERIVNILNKLNEAKAHQIAQLEELERLFPAMLDKAFKGEL